MQTELLKVTGLTCANCTCNVTKALKAINGVGNGGTFLRVSVIAGGRVVAVKSGAVSLGMIVVAPGVNMKEDIAHAESWGVTAIMIVVGFWVLYRYLAPKTWRKWVSGGSLSKAPMWLPPRMRTSSVITT